MTHYQEKNWLYLMRIKDGKVGIKSGFQLPDTTCFDQTYHLKLFRKQTKEWKEKYVNFPNEYRYVSHSSPFDYLPTNCRKTDPAQVYEVHFRMVRLEVTPGHYETLLTNTAYPPETIKKSLRPPVGHRDQFS